MTKGWSTAVPLALFGLCVFSCTAGQQADTDIDMSTTEASTSTTGEECAIGALGCMCTGGGGCDLGLVCSAGICVDEGMTTTMDPTTTGPTSTSEPTTTTDPTTGTTEEPGTCDPDNGLLNPDCPEELPYCSASGICGDCSVLVDCAAIDGDKAVCDVESGSCVECTDSEASACKGATPVCDEVVNLCVGCNDHDQCPDSSCNMESGQCMDPDKVLYLFTDTANSGNCTDMGGVGGTMANPYCVFDVALEHAKNNGGISGWTFKILPGAPYAQAKVVLQDEGSPLTFAIVADENDSTAPEFASVFPTVRVVGDVTLYLHNLDFESGAAISDNPTLLCEQGARLHISRSRIRGGVGPGVRGDDCELTLRDSAVTMNKSEGVEMKAGSLVMRNTFITDNGGGDKWGGGGLSLDQVGIDIAYSTIVDNRSPQGADSISCTKAEAPNLVRNSIIAHDPGNPNASVQCTNLVIDNSMVDGGENSGEGNVKRAAEDILALLKAEEMKGVYRIADAEAATELDGIATRQAEDPRADFEGDPRPLDDGSPDSPGADVFEL